MYKKYICLILFMLVLSSFTVVNADYLTVGNEYYNDNNYLILSSSLGDFQAIYGNKIYLPVDIISYSISAILHYRDEPVYAKAIIFDEDGAFLSETQELEIDSNTPIEYEFVFEDTLKFKGGYFYYITIFADSPRRYDGGAISILYDVYPNAYVYRMIVSGTYPQVPEHFEYEEFTDLLCSIWLNYEHDYYSLCPSTNIQFFNNTINVTGKYEYSYNINTGYKIYMNFTGKPVICDNTSIQFFNNTVNVTGKYEYSYNTNTGYKIYMNFTGKTITCGNTSINIYNNTVNVTGKHEYYYDFNTGFHIWLNYTGLTGNDTCSYPYYFNYSDNNITINITILGCNNVKLDNSIINEDNWFNLMGFLTFDNSQFFIILLLILWVYFIDKIYITRFNEKIFVYGQMFISLPLCIILGFLSLEYVLGYSIVLVIFFISLYLILHSVTLNRKNKY
jgi:hypothetical protein